VTLCPSLGQNACDTNATTVKVLQANFTGTVTESDDCAADVVLVHADRATGPQATFSITGQSNSGTCRAIFTGADGKKAGLAIIIVPPGFSIDTTSHSKP